MTNIMKKIYKVLIIVLMIQIMFAIENVSQAAWWSDMLSTGQNFYNIGKNAAEAGEIIIENETTGNITLSLPSEIKIKTMVEDIYSIIFPLGVAITVVIGGALGIKYMVASAEDKAKVKESMIPYVVGCIAIYGAFGIWKLAITILSGI